MRRVPPPSHSLRLTFAYDGDRLQLIGSQRVEMIAPPSVTPPPAKDQAGHWVELRDAKGALLFHRVLHDPIRTDDELFSDDPKQPITRVPKKTVQGQFTVIVPDLPAADSFLLFGTPSDAKERLAPARELTRHTFEEIRRFAANPPQGGQQVKP